MPPCRGSQTGGPHQIGLSGEAKRRKRNRDELESKHTDASHQRKSLKPNHQISLQSWTRTRLLESLNQHNTINTTQLSGCDLEVTAIVNSQSRIVMLVTSNTHNELVLTALRTAPPTCLLAQPGLLLDLAPITITSTTNTKAHLA